MGRTARRTKAFRDCRLLGYTAGGALRSARRSGRDLAAAVGCPGTADRREALDVPRPEYRSLQFALFRRRNHRPDDERIPKRWSGSTAWRHGGCDCHASAVAFLATQQQSVHWLGPYFPWRHLPGHNSGVRGVLEFENRRDDL